MAFASSVKDPRHAFHPRFPRTTDLVEDLADLCIRRPAETNEVVRDIPYRRLRLCGRQFDYTPSWPADGQPVPAGSMPRLQVIDLVDEDTGQPVVPSVRNGEHDRVLRETLGAVAESRCLVSDHSRVADGQRGDPQLLRSRRWRPSERVDAGKATGPSTAAKSVTDRRARKPEFDGLGERERARLPRGKQRQTSVASVPVHATCSRSGVTPDSVRGDRSSAGQREAIGPGSRTNRLSQNSTGPIASPWMVGG